MPIQSRVELSDAQVEAQTFARSKVKALFVLRPHPYVERDGSVVPDDHSLLAFWALMYRRYGSEPTAAYRICEDLDIHRCVLAEWLAALARTKGVVKSTTHGLVFERTDFKLGIANYKQVTRFDPWSCRDHDRFMVGYFSAFPWFIIDKYYLITKDEVFYYTGATRIRPDGRQFTAVTEDHLSSFRNPNGWKRGEWPEDAYHDLCEAASRQPEEKSRIRRRFTTVAEVTARAAAERARIEAETEARIDKLEIRGRRWLEDFIRRSPWTPDDWFRKALAEETHRHEANARWENIVRNNPDLGKLFRPRVRPLPKRLPRVLQSDKTGKSA